MIEYFQNLFNAAFFPAPGMEGGQDYAVLKLIVFTVVIIAVPLRIMITLGGMLSGAGQGARVPSRAIRPEDDPRYVPPPPMRLTKRRTDGHSFRVLRAFAAEKHERGEALNPQENLARHELTFLHDVLGSDGFSQLDSYPDGLPYRSFRIRDVLDMLGLKDMWPSFEKAYEAYLFRLQRISDYKATGMPHEQAVNHPDLPRYAPLDASLRASGGQARLVAAADDYLDRTYPWAN